MEKLQIKKTPYDFVLEFICAIGLTAVLYPLFSYTELAEVRWPVHFNVSGEINSWGTRSNMWFIPIMTVVMYVGISILGNKADKLKFPVPVTENNKYSLYRLGFRGMKFVKFGVMCIFAYMNIMSFLIATEKESTIDFNVILILSGMLLIITLIMYLMAFLYKEK